MADINVERKGPSIWPWIIGLLVLALLIWAIAEMVDTDEGRVAGVEQVEEPVAAVPTPTPVTPEAEMGAAVDLETLSPLGSDDIGRMARVEGKVIGQPIDQGFWVQTALNGEEHAIFVQTPAHTADGLMLQTQDVKTGQNVNVMGTLTQASPAQASQWAEQAKLTQESNYQQMNVHQDLMLSSMQTGQPGMQPGTQPGMQDQQQQNQQQQGMPGDTMQGRR